MLALRTDEKWLILVCPIIVGLALFVGMGGDVAALLAGLVVGPLFGALIVAWFRIGGWLRRP